MGSNAARRIANRKWACDLHRGELEEPINCRFFEIGMPRTGSRSIAIAAARLGLKAAHGPTGCRVCKMDFVYKHLVGKYDHSRIDPLDFDIYKCYDYCGHCSLTHWQQLSEKKPEAKFILATRPVTSWAESFRKRIQLSTKTAEPWSMLLHEHLLGAPVEHGFWNNRSAVRKLYTDHVGKVLDHFRGTSRLLVLNVWTMSPDELWGKLSDFLEVDNTAPSGAEFPRKTAISQHYHYPHLFKEDQDGI